jgi:DNA ligase OB-like domain/ATP dependent DNA ligase domain/PBZ domain
MLSPCRDRQRIFFENEKDKRSHSITHIYKLSVCNCLCLSFFFFSPSLSISLSLYLSISLSVSLSFLITTMSEAACAVMLAHKWDEKKVDPSGWKMSEKLDGVRAYWSGSKFYSRSGNEFFAPSWYKAQLPRVPLDGELWCGRGLFQQTVSIVRRKNNREKYDNDWKFVTYLVFDAPSYDAPYEERVDYLNTIISPVSSSSSVSSVAAVVGIQECKDIDHLQRELDRVLELGGEGLMLRKPGSDYEHGRSRALLKVKRFFDEEAKVVGHKPGTGRCSGMMGALLCVLPNGAKLTVGTGFTDVQRRSPPKKGSVITFKYQELSGHGNPRFPAFVRIRRDVTWNEVCESAAKDPPNSQRRAAARPVLKKQHSILYSTVPSHDPVTGAAVVIVDGDGDGGGDGATVKVPCKYGTACYRKSTEHLAKFSHPGDQEEDEQEQEQEQEQTQEQEVDDEEKGSGAADDAKPPCRFGSSCYRSSAYHKSQFWHPGDGADDVDEAEAVEESKDERPLCKYGADCFRKSDEHKAKFRHPPKDDEDTEDEEDLNEIVAPSDDEEDDAFDMLDAAGAHAADGKHEHVDVTDTANTADATADNEWAIAGNDDDFADAIAGNATGPAFCYKCGHDVVHLDSPQFCPKCGGRLKE